ncbi:MAG: prepilin-type N-terminal cleavage/methylation domain-containing protein [Coxiellaceae bacterium]|nr:prepilin-type N-terminal cleavage/methylation domain-containing protein [Coxiellaceae bacterium]
MSIVKSYGFTLIELLVALAISSLVCISLFDCVASIEMLHQRQLAIGALQEKIRFLSIFFRKKIQLAGDFSCEPAYIKQQSVIVTRYTAADAADKLSVAIKAKTDLLQLHECVRVNDQWHYLPIYFFVANTHRVSGSGRVIDALFMKIENHPREELLPNVVDFRITIENTSRKMINIGYVLSSIDDVLKTKNAYWFHGEYVMPDDLAFYQPGEIDVVPRYALV